MNIVSHIFKNLSPHLKKVQEITSKLITEYILNYNKMKFSESSIKVEKYPFEHANIPNFLDKDYAKQLLKALDEVEFYREDHDLYSFDRTIDFTYINNETIKKFRDKFLEEDFISKIEKITKTRLNREIIELHSLRLTNTDYLLPHDDQVENRKIAFILNLSQNFEDNEGGALQLFDTLNSKPNKIVKSIYPKFNQFTLFIVSDKSFHQIEEVMTNKIRISVSGWYYNEN